MICNSCKHIILSLIHIYTMMKYFNVDSNQVQILTITNQDERDHLSAYVPLEQIGTRTVSCAYVKPTQSGGKMCIRDRKCTNAEFVN